MRLFVNGIEIPVKGKLEVLMDLVDEGESLPPFAEITVRGGEFRIHGTEKCDGLLVVSENGISVAGNFDHAGIRLETENSKSLTPEQSKHLEESLTAVGATVVHIHHLTKTIVS